jgi:hypothetical protein
MLKFQGHKEGAKRWSLGRPAKIGRGLIDSVGGARRFCAEAEPAKGTSRANILDRLDRDGGAELLRSTGPRRRDERQGRRHRCGGSRLKGPEQVHAALRPNNLLKNPFLSVGIVILMSSPASRRAAAA